MLAILRARDMHRSKQSEVCETRLATPLKKGGGAVEEGRLELTAAPTDTAAEAATPKVEAPMAVKTVFLKKRSEVVEDSCGTATAPIAVPTALHGGGLGRNTAVLQECKYDHCLLTVCGIEHEAQPGLLTAQLSEVKRATPQAAVVRVLPQTKTVKLQSGSVRKKLPVKTVREMMMSGRVKASHQTLVRRFVTQPGDVCTGTGAGEWDSAVKARLNNLENSLAESTGKKYEYWWNRFSVFCDTHGKQKMPFSSMTVSVFLAHLAESADGLGGVDGARAALGFYHSLRVPDQPSPTDSADVKLVIRGIKRRFQNPVCKKSALNNEEFFKVLAAATDNANFFKVPLCKLRLAAQVSLMYSTISRYEESAVLRCSQVVKDKGDLLVTFRKGKTYQMGEARMSVVAAQPGLLNPVKVISVYMDRLKAVHKVTDCLLFPALSSTAAGDSVLDRPASYESVLKQFKLVLVEAGVTDDPSSFGLHSMRRGAATSAVNNGASDHAVQKHMRVMSVSTVRRYATLDKAALKSASSAVFSKH